MASVSIVGGSGYTGQETLDRVLTHHALELYALGSDSLAGQAPGALDPRLGRNGCSRMPRFITNDAALPAGADVTFLCLPHEEAAAVEPPARGVVVDLSGAHRFVDAGVYSEWYGFEHPRPDALGSWSYGLPELSPPDGRLVANPGCYATAVLLALSPLRTRRADGVVVDAKSGMTGAGRSPAPSSHAGFVLENVSPYRVGSHQHAPGDRGTPRLSGHLRPASASGPARPPRHLLVRSSGADLRALLDAHYADSHVVDVLPEGVVPELARVQQHRRCGDRRLRRSAHGPTRSSSARSTTSAKAPRARRSRTSNILFGFAETDRAAALGVLV